jgi:hypothetical protein
MKRVFTIAVIVLLCRSSLSSQVNSVGGSLIYSHQYSENLIGDQLSTWQTRSPAIDLEASGVFLSRTIAEFDLQSYFSENSMLSRGLGLPLDFDVQNWTLYRLNLSLFQYSPCWILYGARDGFVRTHSTSGSEDGGLGMSRSQSQDLTLSLRRISFFPMMTLGYAQAHAWTVEGAPSNNTTQSYTISSSTSGGGASFNISAQTTEEHDLLTDSWSKFSSVQADASKFFNEHHSVNLESRYTWYDQVGSLWQELSYTGKLNDQLLLGSNINLSQTITPFVTTTDYSASASMSHTLSQNWSYTVNTGGFFNTQSSMSGEDVIRTTMHSFSGGLGVTHQSRLTIGSISNALSMGGNWSDDIQQTNSYQLGFSNSYANTFGTTDLHFSQRYAMVLVRQEEGQQFRPSNNLSLSAGTRVSHEIFNQLAFSYNDNRSVGELNVGFFSQSITMNEGIQGNFNYYIPFTVSGGFSVYRYIGAITGTTYGWNASFSSGRFFVDNLSARYNYNRVFDILYHVESVDHSIQFHYSWRMLSIGLSLHERSSFSRQRDVNFVISRPF